MSVYRARAPQRLSTESSGSSSWSSSQGSCASRCDISPEISLPWPHEAFSHRCALLRTSLGGTWHALLVLAFSHRCALLRTSLGDTWHALLVLTRLQRVFWLLDTLVVTDNPAFKLVPLVVGFVYYLHILACFFYAASMSHADALGLENTTVACPGVGHMHAALGARYGWALSWTLALTVSAAFPFGDTYALPNSPPLGTRRITHHPWYLPWWRVSVTPHTRSRCTAPPSARRARAPQMASRLATSRTLSSLSTSSWGSSRRCDLPIPPLRSLYLPISPLSTLHRFLGAFAQAYIVCVAVNITAETRAMSSKRRERRARLKVLLKEKNVPLALRRDVLRHYDVWWSAEGDSHEWGKTVSGLSSGLKMKLLMHTHKNLLSRSSLFVAMQTTAGGRKAMLIAMLEKMCDLPRSHTCSHLLTPSRAMPMLQAHPRLDTV